MILSTPRRVANGMLPKLVKELRRQCETKPVEVLWYVDNKQRFVGTKRNEIFAASKGKYVAFVDDDDRVSMNYIEQILQAINSGEDPDCIVFDALVTFSNTDPGRRCVYGVEQGIQEKDDLWTGKPSHTMVYRRDLVEDLRFPDFNYGEDGAWVKNAWPRIKKQYRINDMLYAYDLRPEITESRGVSAFTKFEEPLLTILIPSIDKRVDSFFPRIFQTILNQIGDRKVEVLVFGDNQKRTVGEKRNELLKWTRGKFFTFVDDDDGLADNYVQRIYDTLVANPVCDCLVYTSWVTLSDNDTGKICRYGIEYEYSDGPNLWTGKPAHTMVWRTGLVKDIAFPSKNFTEDSDWVNEAWPKIKHQIRIEDTLYFYKWREEVSETREWMKKQGLVFMEGK